MLYSKAKSSVLKTQMPFVRQSEDFWLKGCRTAVQQGENFYLQGRTRQIYTTWRKLLSSRQQTNMYNMAKKSLFKDTDYKCTRSKLLFYKTQKQQRIQETKTSVLQDTEDKGTTRLKHLTERWRQVYRKTKSFVLQDRRKCTAGSYTLSRLIVTTTVQQQSE